MSPGYRLLRGQISNRPYPSIFLGMVRPSNHRGGQVVLDLHVSGRQFPTSVRGSTVLRISFGSGLAPKVGGGPGSVARRHYDLMLMYEKCRLYGHRGKFVVLQESQSDG